MPPEQEPPSDPSPSVETPGEPDGEAFLVAQRRKTRRLVLVRLLLFGVSTAGVLGAAVLWVAGRGGLGLRVIAGDLLMILFVLLLF